MRDDVDFNFGLFFGFILGLVLGLFIGVVAMNKEQGNLAEYIKIQEKCSIESDDYIILNNEIYYKK